MHFDEWKVVDEDAFYDWKLVRKVGVRASNPQILTILTRVIIRIKVLRSLRTLREKKDVRGLLGVLETCIRTNFAGVESARYIGLLEYYMH